MIGPLLAYGVGKGAEKAGTISPWRAVFFLLGAMTIVSVPVVWYMMPDSLVTAKFLNERERVIALERLRDNNMGAGSTTVWGWGQTKEGSWTPRPGDGPSCCSAALSLQEVWLPSLVSSSPVWASQISPPWSSPFHLPLWVSSSFLTAAFITNKLKLRAPVIAGLTLFPIGGALAFASCPLLKSIPV